MKVRNFCALSGLAAFGLVASAATAQDIHVTHSNGMGDAVNDNGTHVSACDTYIYDPGTPANQCSGATIGSPSGGDRYECYNQITFSTDVTVCGIDMDGFAVRGELYVYVFPDDGNNCPDINNPLTGGLIDLGQCTSGWTLIDVDPVCLEAGTYWIGTDTGENNDSWHALHYGAGLSGGGFMQTTNDNCNGPSSTTAAYRLRGEEGCGDCLDMAVSTLTAGQTGTWDISGADAGANGVVAWGLNLGQTVVNGTYNYCATFGFDGVNQSRVVGFWTADANGDAQVQRRVPGNVSGLTVHTQAAQQGTCPDECMSGVDTQTIQ